jgi:LmbE family N-acetylglucosaminyl deacetylase
MAVTIDTAAAGPAKVDLPAWRRVLAVVAHPDDESFALGGVLDAFAAAGATTAVLCFTRGEASTLHDVAGPLHRVRAQELAAAAAALGVSVTTLLTYPDGGLARECPARLAGEVLDAARVAQPEGLLVFDSSGVTGHPDHAAATAAALAAADALDLPVLAWTLPETVTGALNREYGTDFTGRPRNEIDRVVRVDRARQREAAFAHASQATPTSVMWRRLKLLGDREHLRLLRGTATSE